MNVLLSMCKAAGLFDDMHTRNVTVRSSDGAVRQTPMQKYRTRQLSGLAGDELRRSEMAQKYVNARDTLRNGGHMDAAAARLDRRLAKSQGRSIPADLAKGRGEALRGWRNSVPARGPSMPSKTLPSKGLVELPEFQRSAAASLGKDQAYGMSSHKAKGLMKGKMRGLAGKILLGAGWIPELYGGYHLAKKFFGKKPEAKSGLSRNQMIAAALGLGGAGLGAGYLMTRKKKKKKKGEDKD